MPLYFKGMDFRTVQVDEEGDIIVVVTDEQPNETCLLVSWDADGPRTY